MKNKIIKLAIIVLIFSLTLILGYEILDYTGLIQPKKNLIEVETIISENINGKEIILEQYTSYELE